MKSLPTDNYDKNLKAFPQFSINKAPIPDNKSKDLSPLVGPVNGVTPASSTKLQILSRLPGRVGKEISRMFFGK